MDYSPLIPFAKYPPCFLSAQQSLLDPPLVLLDALPAVVGKEVDQVEGVVEQALLHLLVQWGVRVEAGTVVHLA